ncbi:MAG: outer membrane protein assembly factor BamB family protein [Planctomycetota bacterium]|jgi:outer membrane protein assembly factor BamB
MKNRSIVFTSVVILWCAVVKVAAVDINGGLVVCIGADALESVSHDWKKPGSVFQCLETSKVKISTLREQIISTGCHGKVSVAWFEGKRLPYINNLVNMLILDSGFEVPNSEIMRVLSPYGVAIVNGKKIIKPYPDEMDEWPQYLHGADNNCVAKDTVVGPPRHVQWISGPAWTRAHIGAATISSMVSSGGRLFTIEDTETAENPLLPAKWKLVARNAFNGIELWTRDYPQWESLTVYIKNYHAQMQRRLIAIGDTVYCTPGLNTPLTALDAATGKALREYKGTEGTQEFVYHDGKLYAMVGDRMHFFSYRGAQAAEKKKNKNQKKEAAKPVEIVSDYAFKGDGFPLSAYNPLTRNAVNPTSVIVALDANSGLELWRSDKIDRYTGCTMALKGDKLVYQSAHGVFCLDALSGKKKWSVEKKIPYGVGNMPNSLVLSDTAVYCEEGKNIHAYSLIDGSDYWGKSIKARKGYQASTDLLIAADALWMCGSCNNAKGIVINKPTGYNLKTGDEIRMIDQILSKPMGHDRCFRNFITERFFINSKTGGPDCMDLMSGAEYPAPFMRATCSMGHLLCNGLIYCGPYACQCHLPVGLHNFNAYYTNEESLPTKGQIVKVERSVRLEKGPAYGKSSESTDTPWPTYRQDARRYGGTTAKVPSKGLKPLWKTKFKTRISAPVIAEDKIFIAEVDVHVLYALNAASGNILWKYIAGGRIDSPPTYYKGLLFFGSRDGWVQCVRASDGVLAWRFSDLPDKMMCAFDQIESAWPVHGSVLIKNNTAYFCVGRSSYFDGGLFIYGLDPSTGKILYQRQFYGPYAQDGFPAFVKEGNRSETEVILGTTADVMTSEGDTLYIRQKAFNLDLTDAVAEKHLLASSGMLESKRHHREYKLVQEDFNHRKMWTTIKKEYPTGDIIVSDGTDYYSVFGIPVNRGESFNPRNGYALMAKRRSGDNWSSKWQTWIPITGKAMVLAGDIVFVAGAPLVFDPLDLGGAYTGRKGGILWAASAANGSKLAEYKLEVLPAWDGMAAAYGCLFIANQDGSIECRSLHWSK